MEFFTAWQKGEDGFQEKATGFYKGLSTDILNERKRLGGDWAIAQAVPSRAMRDEIRQILGPDLVFITLTLDKETQTQRITKRHGEGGMVDWVMSLYDKYEAVTSKEPNSFNVTITSKMTPRDVCDRVIELVST